VSPDELATVCPGLVSNCPNWMLVVLGLCLVGLCIVKIFPLIK
jgi:hypothetical protein